MRVLNRILDALKRLFWRIIRHNNRLKTGLLITGFMILKSGFNQDG